MKAAKQWSLAIYGASHKMCWMTGMAQLGNQRKVHTHYILSENIALTGSKCMLLDQHRNIAILFWI